MLSWRAYAWILRGTAGLFSGLAVLAAVAYLVLLALGYRTVAVYSGSMEPAIRTGAVALVRPAAPGSVRVGDVITFGDPQQAGRLVTHRVVEILRADDGRVGHRTKGDANEERDPWTLSLPPAVGRVAFDVPYAGYAVMYARTREVRGAMIGGFAVFVLVAILRRIWRAPAPPSAPPAMLGRSG